MHFMAAKLLCGQVKATNFISRSSCSYDTMLKKVSFSAQIIHQQLAESLLFHFRFVQLTSKHFSWPAEQKHSATSQLNIPFLLLLVFSQLVYWLSQLHKVGCSKLQCFADRPPHTLGDSWLNMFPTSTFCGKQINFEVSFSQPGMKTDADI